MFRLREDYARFAPMTMFILFDHNRVFSSQFRATSNRRIVES